MTTEWTRQQMVMEKISDTTSGQISKLDAGIFNKIITIFTYNVVEAHRGDARISCTKGHAP
ncbi:MAG: hypothetical protein QXS81_05390 [Candidatus Micrarchaeaceae archaeon]